MRERRRNCPDVAIAQNHNEPQAIREALGLINAESLINPNDVVVITPNWVQKQSAETGIVVGPESLREIIRFVKERNPRRIVVACGSGQQSTATIMKEVGFAQILKEETVEFIDLNTGPFKRIELSHDLPHQTNINTLYDEMTFLISFTQLKYHEEAAMSAAIKNIALSWPPAEEHGHPKKNLGIHEKLHGFIRAMAQKITIDLSIVSASPAMIGTGPAKGIPRQTGLVVSGTDPVAVDTICARFLGFKPQAVYYLYDCINNNLGIGNTDQINLKGLPLLDAEKSFSMAAYGQFSTVDAQS